MTRVLRAASTTSLAMTARSLDPHDALDLDEQAVNQAEVAAGDAPDGGDGLGVGEVGEAELVPVLVGEADPAVELRVAGQALLDAGHADEQQPEVLAVEAVTQVLQRRRGQAFGLVDDQEFHVVRQAGSEHLLVALLVLVDARVDPGGQGGQLVVELTVCAVTLRRSRRTPSGTGTGRFRCFRGCRSSRGGSP